MVKRYDGNAPGWQMRTHDRHYVADLNGDNKADLVVFNANDWSPVYLGRMISTGGGLNCDWSATWIGGWHLGTVDHFEPCHYQGPGGNRDLFVHNTDWFGMLRSTSPWALDKIYYRWIHNYKYGKQLLNGAGESWQITMKRGRLKSSAICLLNKAQRRHR